jgi:hypothetical protein
MAATSHNLIDIIEEHRDVFETIRDEVDDPEAAKRFGEQPLELLERVRGEGGDQS